MTARRILVVLLLATMLASCTGGDGDNPDSGDDQAEGASTVGPITLTVPKGWTEDPKAEERNEDAAWVAPLGDGDTVAPQGVTSSCRRPPETSSRPTSSMQRAWKQPSPVSNAARRRRSTSTAPTAPRGSSGPSRRARTGRKPPLTTCLRITEDGTQVLVRVSTREPPTDAELADAVLGSVAFTS